MSAYCDDLDAARGVFWWSVIALALWGAVVVTIYVSS